MQCHSVLIESIISEECISVDSDDCDIKKLKCFDVFEAKNRTFNLRIFTNSI